MNTWVVGAFYTAGTPYEQVVAEYLLPSIENHKLRADIRESQNFRNWTRNVAEKPKVILDILEELPPEQCLVFLDADASIEKYPKLFDTLTGDLAFHILNWNEWYGYETQPPEMELLTGTMFFRNTERVKDLCREWYREARESHEWEQKVLQRILPYYPDLVKSVLPIEYCFMVSRPGGLEPLVKCEPVIVHHQVSRTLKRGL